MRKNHDHISTIVCFIDKIIAWKYTALKNEGFYFLSLVFI